MSKIENQIKRKIKIRKFAIDNLGLNGAESDKVESNKLEYIDKQEYDILLKNMFNHIRALNDNYYLNPYRPIYSDKKVLGPFIVFVKKVIRKLIKFFLGWYIFPIIDTQNTFNSNAVNSINIMKEAILINTQKIIKLENDIEELNKQNIKLVNENQYVLSRLNVTCDIELLKNTPQIDYFKFENKFRGTRENIKFSQRHYVEYFKTNGGCDILDIGCGRGEFLELMCDYEIPARGIDIYEPFIEYCNNRGFKADLEDALTYLNSLEDNSIGGIFMGQVVEHLSSDYILALIKVAYKKLVPGTYFIIETPNPESISTFQFFYVDMGHLKPIHYLTLEYFFKEANYAEVFRFNNEYSKYPVEAKHIEGDGIENSVEFNKGIDVINELIFGYRDYTIIAKK